MQNPPKAREPEWTILKLLRWTTTYFQSHDIDSPRLTAEILLAHTLNMSRIDLYLQFDQPIVSTELAIFRSLIKRRVQKEPVAYIVGTKEFWSLYFTMPRLGTKVVNGYAPILGFAEVTTDNKVDFPALGKPTNPTSASSFDSIIAANSRPGRPGSAYSGV